ncbi:RagB/SusD family nutrient uptake outer membrane protein [Dokdonia sp. PRO95]|uniref:RagB/SusD family nutrient uptake outer membrane protein n=1 Tax=Dokdonia sp. PRO95 TaxID=1239415 RepID=UPI000555A8BD|nr:RagB/SusD family nutrient uptake outer membrane protein [Dokdonia sp. PRO95]
MKTYKKLALALAVTGLVACESKLELLPEDSQSVEQVFASEAGVRGAVTGLYSLSQQDDVLNGTSTLLSEWQADNIDFVGSFPTFNDVRTYTTLSDNGSVFSIYDDNYEVIGAANNIIAFVPGVEDATFADETRNQFIAEAKFLRALTYFKLANLFGQPLQIGGASSLSVPLVTEPTIISGIEFPQRATLGEVHTQIEQDLVDAIAVLNNDDNSRATKGAAQALLARLYLYQERFAEAATLANDAITNPEFELASDYGFYDTQSSEFFFTLVNTGADGQDSGQGFSGLTNPAPAGRGDAPFSDNLIAAYEEEADDARFLLTQTGTSATGEDRLFTSKFPDGNNNSDNAPVLRVTEAYLTRAEANFRNGSSIGASALTDINDLRDRAGLPALTSLTLDNILNERRKELAFEGQRRMDLLRNNLSLRRPGMPQEAESAAGANKTILPIPAREVELSGLTQNTGY